ncbi:MAG: hypothetical protein H6585_10135 [Flavobacteriales bacterium]|nr:hypothetical protein [Flavobacteriales bacterium]
MRASQPFSLVVKGYDADRPNSYYFRRRVPFKARLFKGEDKGYKEFSIPLPVSPDLLMLEVYDKVYRDDEGFKIEKLEAEKMEPSEVWAEPEMHRFMDFALKFAIKAGYSRPGFYDSKSRDFLIEYLPVIKDEEGYPMITPARTNRKTGRIQVSQMHFRQYTIPIRLYILLHERCHYQIPTRKEKPSDICALKPYLDMGFPETEGVYAATKIFQAHPETVGPKHADRVRNIHAFVDSYIQNKEQKNTQLETVH